ncbi:unnamed protein product [Eretmochelys imbricata]
MPPTPHPTGTRPWPPAPRSPPRCRPSPAADPSGRHIVTILPPTAQVCTAPAVPLSPADPLGLPALRPGQLHPRPAGRGQGGPGVRATAPVTLESGRLRQGEVRPPPAANPDQAGIVVLLFLALLGLTLYGTTLVHDGLYLTDIVPRGTKEHAFIATQAKYFSFYHVFIATQGGFHYPSSQEALYGLHRALGGLPHVVRDRARQPPKMWLHYFQDWLRGLQAAFDREWQAGRITRDSYRNGSRTAHWPTSCSSRRATKRSRSTTIRLTTRRLVDENGIIPPETFYICLTVWVSNDPLGVAASHANFYPPPPEVDARTSTTPPARTCESPAAQPLEFAQFPFYLSGLRQTADFVEAIESVRAVCEEAARERGVASYPSGYPFLFWSSTSACATGSCWPSASCWPAPSWCVPCCCSTPGPPASSVAVLAMMTVELFGIMGLMGIKLSAIPAVILIASVGIGVEFTVHVALGFLTAMGSRTLRSDPGPGAHAGARAGRGALHAAGPAHAGRLRVRLHPEGYFFAVLTVLTVLGLLNGLVLLPVLLSVIGPPAEVIPVDNGSRLPSPEPIPPPISHHGFYVRPPPAWPGAFADSSNSEYYLESTAGSGLAHAQPYDPSAYILPPAPARVLVQAGKNPSFPTITVVKTYPENQEPPGKKEPPSTNQPLPAGDPLPLAGPDLRDLPQHRLPRPGPPGARTAPPRAPRPLRTALPAYSGSYATVMATASVTLALHPPLPGSWQGYTHESYEDSESDGPEEPSLPACNAHGWATPESRALHPPGRAEGSARP